MNNSFSFIVKYNNNEFYLNKDTFSQKPKYFNNIINIMNLK